MAGDHSPAILLLGVGNEKTAADSLGKSCGHTIYWDLGGRCETCDISNVFAKFNGHQNLRYHQSQFLRLQLRFTAIKQHAKFL
jgi:hypothetical protein